VAGRYRLLEQLGSGGFGMVWRAHDEVLRVEVALKQVRVDPYASESERALILGRVRREARSAAKLRDHPNVVTVHDVVAEDGTPWLVMALVRGRSLSQELHEHGTLHPAEAGKVAAAVLAALAAAHAEGIVHRDVKPANIMIAADGTALLADFGIAKHHMDTTHTATGTMIGTLSYMAPERLDGHDLPAGDLFALGASLYEALGGVSPFTRGTTAATISAIVGYEPEPPPDAGYLGPLIIELLSKDPGRRPTAMQALARLAEHRPEPTVAALTTPPTTPPIAPPTAPRIAPPIAPALEIAADPSPQPASGHARRRLVRAALACSAVTAAAVLAVEAVPRTDTPSAARHTPPSTTSNPATASKASTSPGSTPT
jgi:serine/threonine protein kinase